MMTAENVPRTHLPADARLAHGDHRWLRGVGVGYHRAFGPGARLAGCEFGRHRRHAVGLGRTRDQRYPRAVSGGVHQHDADPASADRRAADRGGDRQQRLGPDGIWPRDRRTACRSSSLRPRDRTKPRAVDRPGVESRLLVERSAEGCTGEAAVARMSAAISGGATFPDIAALIRATNSSAVSPSVRRALPEPRAATSRPDAGP